jgi:hypothetical protein
VEHNRPGVPALGVDPGEAPTALTGTRVDARSEWAASASGDNTLRLWPMPDLDQPPVRSLPRDELVARPKSLTNLRAVRDEAPGPGRLTDVR